MVGLLGSPSNVCAVGVEHVWDLEVFEDHSFVANGIVVHNSRSVGKALDVNTPILTASGCNTTLYLSDNNEIALTILKETSTQSNASKSLLW